MNGKELNKGKFLINKDRNEKRKNEIKKIND